MDRSHRPPSSIRPKFKLRTGCAATGVRVPEGQDLHHDTRAVGKDNRGPGRTVASLRFSVLGGNRAPRRPSPPRDPLRRLRLCSHWVARTWDDLHARIPWLIAIAAVLSAFVAWRAALAETQTEEYHLRAVQQFALQTMEKQLWEWRSEQDQRLLARLQEHVRAWRLLDEQAEQIQTLGMQAQEELASARSLLPFFKESPGLGDARGAISDDSQEWLKSQQTSDGNIRRLRPDNTEERAGWVHTNALIWLGTAVLFATSLLFLTIAELTPAPASTRMVEYKAAWANAGLGLIAVGVAVGFIAWFR